MDAPTGLKQSDVLFVGQSFMKVHRHMISGMLINMASASILLFNSTGNNKEDGWYSKIFETSSMTGLF